MNVAAAIDGSSNNQVYLRGRLAAPAELTVLPSGDVLVSFRVTVDRPVDERGRVDSLECATTRARARRSLERAAVGAEIELVGSLRRRFWRGPSGPASRYSVDVAAVRIIRSGRPAAASRGRTPVSA